MAIGTRQNVSLYIKWADTGSNPFLPGHKVPGLMSVNFSIANKVQKYKASGRRFSLPIPLGPDATLDFTLLLAVDQYVPWSLLIEPVDQAGTSSVPTLGQLYDFELVYGEFGQPDCVAFVGNEAASTALEVNANLPGVVQIHMTMACGAPIWVYRGATGLHSI